MATPRLLTDQLLPENYTLSLHVDKDKLSFSGEVVISAKKIKPSQRITLHCKGLVVDEATVVRHDKKLEHNLPISKINYQKKFEEVRLQSDHLMYPGLYTITLKFHGAITKTMLGIYPSYLEDADGKTDVIIATQFESHHAREAFPCVDEPNAKATFDLTLVLADEPEQVVLSNTPLLDENVVDGIKTVTFETTPRMSTYLLAFVYGKMHCIEAKTDSGILVRSWSSTSRPKSQLQYSVDEAVKLLDFYADYFGTPYPLSKLDQVALPDFDAGAMENWGLVTYREIAMLADADNRSVSQEQYVSLVVAHELSHQWFGNLVTMKWWDDLWLNESFASLMEHLALDAIHPDWKQWENYTATDVISTTSRDIYKDIQPVGVKVTDVQTLETLFDPGIVYAKGGRLLKMLREYISDKDFSMALKIYFKRHGYGNTSREDLWKAMSEVSGQDISALMTPWIVQSGLPVLKIDETEPALVVSQQRYVLDTTDTESLWPIPLLADTDLKPNLLKTQKTKLTTDSDEYVLFNQYGSGHFICQYVQPEHRQTIARRLGDGSLPTEARINILNDILMLARRGDSPLTDGLELVVAMKAEDRDSVWGLISRTMGTAALLTEGDEDAERVLKQIRRDLAGEWYRKLGWDDAQDDDPNTKQLRHTAISFMASGEDEAVIAEAKRRYASTKLEDLSAELRGAVLSIMVRHGEAVVVDRLLDAYTSASPDLQLDITGALSSTKQPAAAKKILERAVGPKGFVRDQDLMRWIALFMRNHYVREIAWQHLVDNFVWFDKVLGPSKAYDYLPVYCAGVITTEDWQQRYVDFFTPLLSNKAMEKNIKIGMADIEARVAWRKRDEAKIKQFLADYK